jgi:amidohydrolase
MKLMTKDQLKQKVCERIEQNADKIIGIGREIFAHPELGFKEYKTSKLFADTLRSLQLECRENIALTGVKAIGYGRTADASVMLLGELDAVISPQHPFADSKTGAAHSCGHHAQTTAVLGAAMGLVPFLEELDGNVVFAAVPAEEYVELEWRKGLRDDGKITFFGGKQEWIHLGEFDDIDAGLLVHSHAGVTEQKFLINCDSSGFIGKVIHFIGKEAHAGAEPYNGINALNAANLALMAINAQRETFKESDRIRVHPIITKGGDLVNIVPADVRMETYVRGRTISAIEDASEKVNRAVQGSAMAIGAQFEISEIPGYLALRQNEAINRLFADNAMLQLGPDCNLYGYELMGATDAGDVSSIIPFAHLSCGGFSGVAHSKSFAVCDERMAYILPAQVMAMTVIDLLFDHAELARSIKREDQPPLNKESFVTFWEQFNRTIN